MVYLLAVVMGCISANNLKLENRLRASSGFRYHSAFLGFLSTIGGIGGWFCVLPAAYFVGSDYGNGFLDGFYFVTAFIAGVSIGAYLVARQFLHTGRLHWVNYLLSSATIGLNAGLAWVVYSLT